MPEQTPVDQGNNVLLEIKGLRTYFHLAEGVVRAVDGVDLTIHKKETLGIVGESGCGKSISAFSTLRLISPPGKIEAGDIFFHKSPKTGDVKQEEVINLTRLDPGGQEIRDIRGNYISMVFQEPMTAMSPVRTIGQQITEAVMLHHDISKAEARSQTIEMLRRVRMANPERVVDDYPFQLSGGMRQRAVIAMALICRPTLLIADEPTTALDVTTEAQILNLMRDLQDEFGMAIQYITHNLGVIAEMAENVAVMYLGRVVEQCSVQEIFANPLHPYTQGLLQSIPQLSDAVRRSEHQRLHVIKGMVPDPYARIKGCPFHPRCPRFMPGVCDEVEPAAIQHSPDHMVRCHLYN
jgi:peptide/nickel transport system ATP-binding protein